MLKQFLFALVCSIGITMLLMYIFQRQLIYAPVTEIPSLKAYHATDMSEVFLHTNDNVLLRSWYKPALDHQPTILFLHGNSGHIGYRMPFMRAFIKEGFGVFLLEYRGYGGNAGTPTEMGFYEDGRAALQFLLQHAVLPEHIVLFGESLGSGVATKLAEEQKTCALVLQSPFTSLASVSRYHYPWLILKPKDRYDSLSRIKQIHTPLLVLHSKSDIVVPYKDGLSLFKAAHQPKKMCSFDNIRHDALWTAPGLVEDVISFTRAHCVD